MGTGIRVADINQIKQYAEDKEYDKALVLIRQQDLSKTFNSQFARICGEVLLYTKNYEESRYALINAHKMAPEGNRINYDLIMLYLETGELALAEKYYEQYVFNAGEEDYDLCWLNYHMARSKHSPAQVLYDALAPIHTPDRSDELAFEFMRIYRLMGDQARFDEEYQYWKDTFRDSIYKEQVEQLTEKENIEKELYTYPDTSVLKHDAQIDELEESLLEQDYYRMYPKEPEIVLMADDYDAQDDQSYMLKIKMDKWSQKRREKAEKRAAAKAERKQAKQDKKDAGKADEKAAKAGAAETKPDDKTAETKPEDKIAETKIEDKAVEVKTAETKPEAKVAETKIEDKAAEVKTAETKPENKVAKTKIEDKAAEAEAAETNLTDSEAEAVTKDSGDVTEASEDSLTYDYGEEEEASEYVDEAVEYAEETSEYDDEAVEYAEEAQEYGDEAAEYAEEVSEYGDEAAEYAEEASEYGDEAAEYAEEASEYGDEAAEYAEEASEYDDEAAEYVEEASEYSDEAAEYAEEASEHSDETEENSQDTLEYSGEASDKFREYQYGPPKESFEYEITGEPETAEYEYDTAEEPEVYEESEETPEYGYEISEEPAAYDAPEESSEHGYGAYTESDEQKKTDKHQQAFDEYDALLKQEEERLAQQFEREERLLKEAENLLASVQTGVNDWNSQKVNNLFEAFDMDIKKKDTEPSVMEKPFSKTVSEVKTEEPDVKVKFENSFETVREQASLVQQEVKKGIPKTDDNAEDGNRQMQVELPENKKQLDNKASKRTEMDFLPQTQLREHLKNKLTLDAYKKEILQQLKERR